MSIVYSSVKSRVTREWAAYCAGFRVWKPKQLLRLHGPVIMGVRLDSLSDPYAYQPYFHIHSLMTPFEVITLGLCGPFLTENCAYQQVSLRMHDSEMEAIIARFLAQYPQIAINDFCYSQYVQTVANVLKGKYGSERGYIPHVYRDLVLVAWYCGQVELALEELECFVVDLKGRCDYTMPMGGLERWHRDVKSLMNKEHLEETIQDEKAKFWLEGFEDHGFRFDMPVRLFDL